MDFKQDIRLGICLSFLIAAISCEDYEDVSGDYRYRDILSSVVGTYQAEDHTFQSRCSEKSKKKGYTGRGYMDYGGNGSLVEWSNVNVSSTGRYTLIFRYANGKEGDRSCRVTVNDTTEAGEVSFPSTGRWKNWKLASIDVKLKAGANKIRLTADTNNGGPNLDKLDVAAGDAGGGAECAEVEEWEKGTLSCPAGKIIGSIDFASYGLPEGSCNTGFSRGACHATSSKDEVEASCLNRQSCSIKADNDTFSDPCPGKGKMLAVTYSCVAGDGDGGGDSDAGSDGMPVFLLAGQSNMVGNVDLTLFNQLMSELASGSSATRRQRLIDRIKSWYQDSDSMEAYSAQAAALDAAELIRLNGEGLVNESLSLPYSKVYCSSSDNPKPQPLELNCGHPYGPELVLGHALGKASLAPTSLVKVAEGGTTLYSDWLPPSGARRTGREVGCLYKQLSQKIQALKSNPASVHPDCAKQKCRWAGFIWFQGENDSFDAPNAGEYHENLRSLISDVRSEIGSAKLPVVVVQINAWAQSMDYGQQVADAQRAVVSSDPNAKLVVTDDLGLHYHYDSAGQLIIGARVANALIPMIDSTNGGGGTDGGDTDSGSSFAKCAQANEFSDAVLYCPSGRFISGISFASWGTPSGTCPKFTKGTCHASSSQSKVEFRCLNKPSCRVAADNEVFGDPCAGVGKKLAVVYTCSGGDNGNNGGYAGSGLPLPLKQYMLNECEADEQQILKARGFTKHCRVTVDNWIDIVTVQGSPKLKQELVDSVCRESARILKPIKDLYPDRLRKVLDFNQGTINIVIVYGSGYGWSGGMGEDGMLFKRNGNQDGGLFHEWGHVFDLHPYVGAFRSHIDSILAPEDADVIDKFCKKDNAFINDDGSCQYSEFVACKYSDMHYVEPRNELRRNFNEVYQTLLKYVPTPSSYVPFEGIPFYDLP